MTTVSSPETMYLVRAEDASQVVVVYVNDNLLVNSGEVGTVVSSSEHSIVLKDSVYVDTIIQSGIPGPQGPAGQSEEDMQYAKRLDSVSSTEMYKGEAVVGSLTTSALWRIQKIIFGNDGDVTITWADGNANFDNIWDNRLSLSYS